MLRNLLILLTFLWLPSFAFAQDLPRPLSDTVNDFDDILPEKDEIWLSTRLSEARAKTGIHIVLVTMARRENHGGAGRSIEDYTKLLFNQWGVGDAARNDGVMILISSYDREMRIQLGSGYGSEWDGVAFGVIQEHFLPLMREGEMVKAIGQGSEKVIEKIAQPFAGNEAPPSGYGSSDQSSEFGPLDLILMGGVGLLMIYGMLKRYVGDLLVKLRPCPQCGFSGGMARVRQTVLAASQSNDGEGLQITSCNKCGYRDAQSYRIPSDSDRDNDSGGYGGGQSSGGGATGRW